MKRVRWGGRLRRQLQLVTIQRPSAYENRTLTTIATGIECLIQPYRRGSDARIEERVTLMDGVAIEDIRDVAIMKGDIPKEGVTDKVSLIQKGDFLVRADSEKFRIVDKLGVAGTDMTHFYLVKHGVA